MITIDTSPREIPRQEAGELQRFRQNHPLKRADFDGVEWEYIEAGRGSAALLILPGILGVAEMGFQVVQAFEDEFRVIAPSYPHNARTVDELTGGIYELLRTAGIEKADLLGGSFGGLLAQRLVRRYPGMVKNLVLSHTGAPDPGRVQKNQKFISLMRWLPMGLLRGLLRQVTRKSLEDAGDRRAFWTQYTDEITARLSKEDLTSRYQVAVDFDASSSFSPDDLMDWSGRILILEGDNDPVAEVEAQEALKALYPEAKIHTFHGSGHVASIAKLPEYTGVIRSFLKESES